MKFFDLLKLSTRMFRARTSRTLLTILGMGVGIGAILFLVSLGYGLQKTLLERITTADSLLTLDVSEAKAESGIINGETLSKIREMEGVAEISPMASISSRGTFEGLSSEIAVFASDPSFLRLSGVKIINGNEQKSDEEVLINSAVAKVFGKTPEEMIGREINLYFSSPENAAEPVNLLAENNSGKIYKITGVIEGEAEGSIVFLNLDSLSFEVKKFSQVKVKCQSDKVMGAVREKILNMGLVVSALSDTVDQANKIFAIIQIILMFFGVIALVVSAIGMFNTMTIALLERTSEIGIMKSIGASDKSIAGMFIMESAIMGFLGGICGILLGFLGGFIFNFGINVVAVRMGGEKVDLFYSPLWFVLTIIAFAALVGIITGFIPARRASKIDPLEALRYK